MSTKILHKKARHRNQKLLLQFALGITLGILGLILWIAVDYDKRYQNLIYPGISIGKLASGGKTPQQVTDFWLNRNLIFSNIQFTFKFEQNVATISGARLELGYDATLSATQAFNIGRSGHVLTDMVNRYQAYSTGIDLQPLFHSNEEALQAVILSLSQKIEITPENALFEFNQGRVTAFKTSKPGRYVDSTQLLNDFKNKLQEISQSQPPLANYEFILPVKPKEPDVRTDQANEFGITEIIGKGESWFRGSIPGRVHNVALAASRINGTLILPNQTFSFNATVGDISAATGYKQAYVIKSGRTVLDDGGGVCQVSTTLFRAALNSGLPVIERHAHSYRVGYYEQGGWKPGFDATVYAPSYDLKIKNDTANYLLIQAITDTNNAHLTFELYGKKDGRVVEISPVRLWDAKPAPPDLFQDDPMLPVGQTKQVDWSNPGIKAAFDYKVTRGQDILSQQTFFSNFIPWQAVYLRGTRAAQ